MKVPNRNKAGRLCLPRWLNIKIWAQLERRVRSENHDQYVMIGWQSLRPNTMYSARQKIWVRCCSRLPSNWRILKGGAVPISLCLPLRPCSPLQRLLLSPFDRVCCARTEMVMYLCMYVCANRECAFKKIARACNPWTTISRRSPSATDAAADADDLLT